MYWDKQKVKFIKLLWGSVSIMVNYEQLPWTVEKATIKITIKWKLSEMWILFWNPPMLLLTKFFCNWSSNVWNIWYDAWGRQLHAYSHYRTRKEKELGGNKHERNACFRCVLWHQNLKIALHCLCAGLFLPSDLQIPLVSLLYESKSGPLKYFYSAIWP